MAGFEKSGRSDFGRRKTLADWPVYPRKQALS
jgi:hypothetical protein